MDKWVHKYEGAILGNVDAISSHPDGKLLVRINDHWYFGDDFEPEIIQISTV